jgi:hypothetical protein
LGEPGDFLGVEEPDGFLGAVSGENPEGGFDVRTTGGIAALSGAPSVKSWSLKAP